MVRRHPAQDVTFAGVASSEDAAWAPVRLLDAAVAAARPAV